MCLSAVSSAKRRPQCGQGILDFRSGKQESQYIVVGLAPYNHSDTPSVIKDNLKKLEKWNVKHFSLPVAQCNEDFDQKHCDGGLIF